MKLFSQRKGIKPSIRRQRYNIRPKDLVKINNKIYEIIKVSSYGKCIKIKGLNKLISPKKLDGWIYHSKTLVFDKE